MLYNGENIGDGSPPQTDIAVDPIDGTTPIALGRGGHWRSSPSPSAAPCSTRAVRLHGEDRGRPEGKGSIDIEVSAPENSILAKALGRPVRDLTAVILDRPRHEELIARCAKQGPASGSSPTGRGRALATVRADISGADVLFGIGGTLRACSPPQPSSASGARSKAALAAQRRRARRRRRRRLRHRRRAPHRRPRLGRQRLLRGDRITDGDLLQGVRYLDFGATTSPWCCARARGRCGRSTPSTRSPSCRVQRLVLNRRNGSAQRGPWSGPLPAAQTGCWASAISRRRFARSSDVVTSSSSRSISAPSSAPASPPPGSPTAQLAERPSRVSLDRVARSTSIPRRAPPRRRAR